ncbi:MAG: NADH-quinone oxidoreductase subunit NuoE [Gammaproteobacteria bacterium]
MIPRQQTTADPDLISAAARAEIDRWIDKYPADQKQAAVMAALRVVQDENGGWLTQELMDAVAAYLEMPPVAVYEVATFYSMYELKPVGRHKICVCDSISCMLNGSDRIVDHLKKKLGVEVGEVTPDGKFSIKIVECLGACVGGPMFMIGNRYYEDLTAEKIDRILDELD